MEHDLFGKPVSTFPDHALTETMAPAQGMAAGADCGRQKRRSHPARRFRENEQAEDEHTDIEREGLTG
jgi:hypothetical protein